MTRATQLAIALAGTECAAFRTIPTEMPGLSAPSQQFGDFHRTVK